MKIASVSFNTSNNTKNEFFSINHAKKKVYKFNIPLHQNEVTFMIEIYQFKEKNKIHIMVIDLFKILDNKTKKEIEKIL